MRVVIHADASTAIGTGHLIRCLALASALRRIGVEVVLASHELSDRLRHRAESLGVGVTDRADAPRSADWLVVDGYHLDRRTRSGLADGTVPRLVIDDLGGDLGDASLVLNQNLSANPGNHGAPPGVEALTGPAYALLRPDFEHAAPEREQPDVAERVLVTLGGSDPHDASAVAIDALVAARPPLEVRIIIGAAHPAPSTVEAAARAAGFSAVRDASSLAPHLAWCDLVISGCGGTVLEAACLGRPVVGVILADNQRRVARAMEATGIGIVAGVHPGLEVLPLRSAVDALRRDHARREAMAVAGPQLVDGHGASRVSRVLASGPLGLRSATTEDADLLLDWRNDAETRHGSFDRALIAGDDHRAWLAERLRRNERIWIGEVRGVPIGVVRFETHEGQATVSVTIAPAHRGAGFAARIIASGCSRLLADGGPPEVEAWIRPGNLASISAFRIVGFRPGAAEPAPDRVRYVLSMAPMG